jgi:hypothetical protein
MGLAAGRLGEAHLCAAWAEQEGVEGRVTIRALE